MNVIIIIVYVLGDDNSAANIPVDGSFISFLLHDIII